MPVNTYYPSSYSLGTNGSNFINPGNIYSDNGVYCTVTQTAKNTTSQIYLEGFNINDIPIGSTINSVTINVDRKMSTTASVQSVALQAYKSTTAMGTKATSTAEPSTDTVFSSTTTGTWTVADFTNFRLLLENIRGNSTTACTISYDYVSVTIDYTAPSYDFNGSMSISTSSSLEVISSKNAGEAFDTTAISAIIIGGSINTYDSVTVASVGSSIEIGGKHGGFNTLEVSSSSSISITGSAFVSFDRAGLIGISTISSIDLQVRTSKKDGTNIYALTGLSANAYKTAKDNTALSTTSFIDTVVSKESMGQASIAEIATVDNFGNKKSLAIIIIQTSTTLVILGQKYEQSYDSSGVVEILEDSGITLYGFKNGSGEIDISSIVSIISTSVIGTSERIVRVISSVAKLNQTNHCVHTFVTHQTSVNLDGVYRKEVKLS